LVDRTGVSNDEGRVTEWDSVCQARIGPNLLLCKGQKPRRSRPLCLAWSNLDLGTLLTFQALTMDTGRHNLDGTRANAEFIHDGVGADCEKRSAMGSDVFNVASKLIVMSAGRFSGAEN